jgi:hypothetical protein
MSIKVKFTAPHSKLMDSRSPPGPDSLPNLTLPLLKNDLPLPRLLWKSRFKTIMTVSTEPGHSFNQGNAIFPFVIPENFKFTFQLSTQAKDSWFTLTCRFNILSVKSGNSITSNRSGFKKDFEHETKKDGIPSESQQPDSEKPPMITKFLHILLQPQDPQGLLDPPQSEPSPEADDLILLEPPKEPSKTFTDLPAELRNKVYCHLLYSPVPIKPQLYTLMHPSLPHENQIFPALTQTTREIRKEATSYLYSENTFHFPNGKVLFRNSPWQFAKHIYVQAIKPLSGMAHTSAQWYPVLHEAIPWENLDSLHTLGLEIKLWAEWARSPVHIALPIVEMLTTLLDSINLSSEAAKEMPLYIASVTYVSGWHGKADWVSSGQLTQGTVCIVIMRKGVNVGDRKYLWPEQQLCDHRGSKWQIQKGELGLLEMDMTWVFPGDRDSS